MSAEFSDAPAPRALSSVFYVYDVVREGDELVYYGEPLVDQRTLHQTAWPLFDERGYEVSIESRPGETVLVAEPARESGAAFPWTNVALAVLTVLTTLYAGTQWYHVDPLSLDVVRALPFVAAVMGVLGVHEFGHYLMSRYHDVDASLPYFIPIPFTPIGTLGAVIKMKGVMPDRKALFDIGVAGPVAGLVATIVVSAVGLLLPPISVPAAPAGTVSIAFGNPPLLRGIAWLLGQPLAYGDGLAVSPVVFGGWVGMFVTFLNLLPVGQLDGGHVMRAVFGPSYERVAPLVPGALFGLAGYVYFALDAPNGATVWLMWGVITSVFVFVGTAHPANEEPLDRKRLVVAGVTLLLGLLCFMPVPIRIVG
ncbi:site-2 protease family protein [Halarchaeum grantii]|uniref:Site-2 protease family protein n=1 Tax=Halarchaeum grantii TaxID=1193105 RepID=A0A830F0N0_9EURY|nr:site-2 protease family protein [Halarchaeum grantii]GGL27894.1 site-2 protease family protein [Halarchaeum grantii]